MHFEHRKTRTLGRIPRDRLRYIERESQDRAGPGNPVIRIKCKLTDIIIQGMVERGVLKDGTTLVGLANLATYTEVSMLMEDGSRHVTLMSKERALNGLSPEDLEDLYVCDIVEWEGEIGRGSKETEISWLAKVKRNKPVKVLEIRDSVI